MRFILDSCITQRKAQGPSRNCNESKEEGKKDLEVVDVPQCYLTESFYNVILQKSISAQIRQLILHIMNRKGFVK